jgi:hypothetical protein
MQDRSNLSARTATGLCAAALVVAAYVVPAHAQAVQVTHTAAVSDQVAAVSDAPAESTPSVHTSVHTSHSAHVAATSPRRSQAPVATANRFFVDFRARTAASYGHAFLWYGRTDANGKVRSVEVAGLHPATDSVIPYIIGHVFPVPSETGKSYGDLDEDYLTASYRVYLSDADARKVFAYIKYKQAHSPVWTAGGINCTLFIADVANYMGLKTPLVPSLTYPETLVNDIKRLNGGRTEVSLAAGH